MTAINHALTGAAIGLFVGEPIFALPAAVMSHFVCDAIPHYGSQTNNPKLLRTKGFRYYLIVEASLCFVLVLCLAFVQPEHWLLASVCAFLATSPDFLWINRYIKARQGRKWQRSAYSKFAAGIQWFQRPIGAVVEAAWFVATLVLLASFLR